MLFLIGAADCKATLLVMGASFSQLTQLHRVRDLPTKISAERMSLNLLQP